MNKTPERMILRKGKSTARINKYEPGPGRSDGYRPRSRSVFTTANVMAEVSPEDEGQVKLDGPACWPSYVPKPITVKNYFGQDFNNDYSGDEQYQSSGTVISPQGVISIRLNERIRVDISPDRAVRVSNGRNGIVLALSASGASTALIHPNGRVYQYGSRVEIMANDSLGNDKFAKMWYKGVSFSSMQCALVYLVDSAGTRTTTDTFNDLSQHDFTLNVLYENASYLEQATSSTIATQLVNEAVNQLANTNYWFTEDDTENWIINNVRISQTSDGLVRVGRQSNKFCLRTSPTNGSASISTPFMHCTGSLGTTRHLFVRRGERRMHYDGQSFIVRNAGHSAGFDEKQQLKVY